MRSVVQLYPGPFCYLCTPRLFRGSRGRHFCDLSLNVVRCVVRSCSSFEPSPCRQSLLHRCRISPLVAGQDRLRAFPASEFAEISEWGVLHFCRKLPAESVPAAARLGRQFGQRLPLSHQSRSRCRESGLAGSEGAGCDGQRRTTRCEPAVLRRRHSLGRNVMVLRSRLTSSSSRPVTSAARPPVSAFSALLFRDQVDSGEAAPKPEAEPAARPWATEWSTDGLSYRRVSCSGKCLALV